MDKVRITVDATGIPLWHALMDLSLIVVPWAIGIVWISAQIVTLVIGPPKK